MLVGLKIDWLIWSRLSSVSNFPERVREYEKENTKGYRLLPRESLNRVGIQSSSYSLQILVPCLGGKSESMKHEQSERKEPKTGREADRDWLIDCNKIMRVSSRVVIAIVIYFIIGSQDGTVINYRYKQRIIHPCRRGFFPSSAAFQSFLNKTCKYLIEYLRGILIIEYTR